MNKVSSVKKLILGFSLASIAIWFVLFFSTCLKYSEDNFINKHMYYLGLCLSGQVNIAEVNITYVLVIFFLLIVIILTIIFSIISKKKSLILPIFLLIFTSVMFLEIVANCRLNEESIGYALLIKDPIYGVRILALAIISFCVIAFAITFVYWLINFIDVVKEVHGLTHKKEKED